MKALRPIEANQCEPTVRIAERATRQLSTGSPSDMPTVRYYRHEEEENAPIIFLNMCQGVSNSKLYDIIESLSKQADSNPDNVASE